MFECSTGELGVCSGHVITIVHFLIPSLLSAVRQTGQGGANIVQACVSPCPAPRLVSVTISLSAKAAAMRMSTPRSLVPSLATALEPRRTLTPRTLGRAGGGRSPLGRGYTAHVGKVGGTRATSPHGY